jgi:hypothetical protein
MNHSLPLPIPLLFGATVAVMAAFVALAVHHAANAHRLPPGRSFVPAGLATFVLTAWLALTGVLAVSGFYQDFSAVPPRFMSAVLPPLLLGIALTAACARPGGRLWLKALPQAWLVGAQGFRLPVEIVLWALYTQGALAPLMTFHGRNWDVLVGVTAPAMALLAARRGAGSRRALIVWNLAGLALLVNVAAHGILSAPTPFRVFFTDPPNMMLTTFPYAWLPGFLVPLAFFLHALSLLKLFREP